MPTSAAHVLAVGLLAASCCSAAPPATFPPQLTYSVELTMRDTKVGDPKLFVGRHYLDAKSNKGRVDWQITNHAAPNARS